MHVPPRLFDSDLLARHRVRAEARGRVDFLHEAVAAEITERLSEVNRTFRGAVVIGPRPDIWVPALSTAVEGGVRSLPDTEVLDLREASADLVVHGLALHWANDPVGQLVQMRRALRPDGLMIAALFGGETLAELRAAFAEAEVEVLGGLSPRVAPMGEIRDLGGLLQRAGFALPVADSLRLDVRYATVLDLMRDLRGMGETNALADRLRRPMRRELLGRVGALYTERFGGTDGRVGATFEVVFLTGWAPSADQPKPLRPGSARARLADALGTTEYRAGEKAGDGRGAAEIALPGGGLYEAGMSRTSLPPDHPAIPPVRVGVILANLGTPDATDYWSMRRYLGEFLSDRRVIDYSPWFWQPLLQLVILTKRPFTSGANYRKIWNRERDESPLLTITREQAEAVAARMRAAHGDRVVVDFAMRYGNPSTPSVIGKLRDQGCERIVFFPLYPQYSAPTTATANDQAFRSLMAIKWQPAIRTVPAYHDHPLYIEALAQSVERVYAGLERGPDVLVTSYHGMPERYLREGDPYHCQCRKTTRLLRDRLGFGEDEVVVSFQSRFGNEEWLKPYTVEEVARLAQAGRRHLAIMAPAFSADCVETLEEVSFEIRDAFLAAGGESFTYIPCLNADAAHVDMMVAILERELAGWV